MKCTALPVFLCLLPSAFVCAINGGANIAVGWGVGYSREHPGDASGALGKGLTVVAWINYQAKEPVEGVASVMVRDIARILTPDHIPFVYEKGAGSLKP